MWLLRRRLIVSYTSYQKLRYYYAIYTESQTSMFDSIFKHISASNFFATMIVFFDQITGIHICSVALRSADRPSLLAETYRLTGSFRDVSLLSTSWVHTDNT